MSLLKFERPRINNLGELVSRLSLYQKEQDALWDDLKAYGAPSECYSMALDNKGFMRDMIIEQICVETGLTYKAFFTEVCRRGSYKKMYWRF